MWWFRSWESHWEEASTRLHSCCSSWQGQRKHHFTTLRLGATASPQLARSSPGHQDWTKDFYSPSSSHEEGMAISASPVQAATGPRQCESSHASQRLSWELLYTKSPLDLPGAGMLSPNWLTEDGEDLKREKVLGGLSCPNSSGLNYCFLKWGCSSGQITGPSFW